MDSAVWCNTSRTIMELVFARLPLGQIFQMRVLSKYWRASIMSPSFQHAFGTTTSSRFAFIAGLDSRRIWSYDIREWKWYSLQFEFLPMYCDSPIAGDGGLLCCLRPANPTIGIHDLELYVCNPMTQAWRKLPFPSRVQKFDLVHMVTDTETKQYTITTVSQRQSGSSKAVMEVYNSATNTWNANSKGAFQSAGNNLVYYKKYVRGHFVGIKAYDQTTGYSTSTPFDISFEYFLYEIMYSAKMDSISSEEMVGISYAPCICPATVYQGVAYMLRTEEGVQANGVWVLRPPNHVWEKLYSVPDPDELAFYVFSLIVSADVIAIFGDGDCNEEQPRKPYFWMLDRAQDTWIDMTDQKLDHIRWSQLAFEMRLDAIP